MMVTEMPDWIKQINWGADGLIPVIIQDHVSNVILMHAWMNQEALTRTLEERQTVFWSRSRQCFWKKGSSSGHFQHIDEIRLDCDSDTLLIRVRQQGGISCHTGRASCFYRRITDEGEQVFDPVIKDPDLIYKSKL